MSIIRGENMFSLTALFFRVLKLGATAYGGPGMISQIKEMAVKEKGWMKEGEFMRAVALCQLIPGATMIQIVTYMGYR
jgi:chromate transporter